MSQAVAQWRREGVELVHAAAAAAAASAPAAAAVVMSQACVCPPGHARKGMYAYVDAKLSVHPTCS